MMITPKKPMRKIYIVKALPGNGALMSDGVTNGYTSRARACGIAEGLAVKERRRFVVFEAVACYDVAHAIEIPIIDVENHPAPIDCDDDDCDICAKEPWHEEDTTCEDIHCPVCNCTDGSCGNCGACSRRLNHQHSEENCEDTLCHHCYPVRKS